jgi:hypothetical protein
LIPELIHKADQALLIKAMQVVMELQVHRITAQAAAVVVLTQLVVMAQEQLRATAAMA